MGERRGTKALELWCRRITDGYPGVKVDNMTTSWRDGLAFCALIHHFRPDLIDFTSLKKEDVYHNNELAFRTAETYLGIPALLDAEDMAQYDVPDRLSILTYLSQFYQHFASQPGSPGRLMAKRSSTSTDRDALPDSPASSSPPTKMLAKGLGRREPCVSCGQPVFLAQRLVVDKRNYHRTCFRCARCNNQLSLAAYYETEKDGQYCCEVCPDEDMDIYEETDSITTEDGTSSKCSLNEEQTSGNTHLNNYHNALKAESAIAEQKKPVALNESSKALSGFLTSQFQSHDDDDDVVPALPLSPPPASERPPVSETSVIVDDSDKDSAVTDLSVNEGLNILSPLISENINISDSLLHVEIKRDEPVALDSDPSISPKNEEKEEDVCNKNVNIEDVMVNQLNTASVEMKNDDREVNNDKIIAVKPPDELAESSNSTEDLNRIPSLVSERRKMFEVAKAPEIVSHKINSDNIMKNANVDDKNILRRSSDTTNELSSEVKSYETKKAPAECTEKHNLETIQDEVKQIITQDENEDLYKEDTDSQKIITVEEKEDLHNNETDSAKESVKIEEYSECSKIPQIEEALPPTPVEKSETLELIEVKPIEKINEVGENLPDEVKCSLESKSEKPASSKNTTNEDNTSGSLKKDYPKDMNPFSDSEDDEDEANTSNNKANIKLKITPPSKESTNPFGSCSEDEEPEITKTKREKPPRPPPPAILSKEKQDLSGSRRVIPAPSVNLNPFWSEGEEDTDEENHKSQPVARLRTKEGQDPTPMPRLSLMSGPPSFHGSSTSLTSTISRKKKPAPKPPTSAIFDRAQTTTLSKEESIPENINEVSGSSMTSYLSTPNSSMTHVSPQSSPRSRKRRPAPRPPPAASSTLIDDSKSYISHLQNPVVVSTPNTINETSSRRLIIAEDLDDSKLSNSTDWDGNNSDKNELNKSRQSTDIEVFSPVYKDKSVSGQWKRRKGPAPGIPLFQKFSPGPPIPAAVLRKELQLLETQQRGLEKQGVRIEEIIRERTEGITHPDDIPMERDPVTDDLVLQLFELVNEKNELFRRQSELMYIRRQQRLEEEHADLENQIRLLMASPDANKTDSDKEREEELICRLMEVVERRNELVASMEMDRVREREEDKSIRERMASHRAKKEMLNVSGKQTPSETDTLEKKKVKKKWLKKIKKDKEKEKEISDDIEEKKDKKSKKWFN